MPAEQWGEAVEPETIGCLIGTSEHGGQQFLREWNELCIETKVTFFPVVLHNMIGYIGPVTIPGETACYECLRGRINAHLVDPVLARAAESLAFEGQAVVAYHPAMLSVLADLAVMELSKCFGRGMAAYQVGTMVRINLTLPEISNHRILRLPRCPVCSDLNTRPTQSSRRINWMLLNPTGE